MIYSRRQDASPIATKNESHKAIVNTTFYTCAAAREEARGFGTMRTRVEPQAISQGNLHERNDCRE